ncbi:hypothetical protein [Atopobium sp. oral taxon 810]|uniref:hypothetical protein n=1 Tax=Atopobium sp. oral taxon 810 TaxID=712158 RepID=UPI0003967864|nr:hypothetical protein [Atopobium sp. oral taxon 810]ERI05874.1 hypothetical protein HMPREF9069_00611 [Atopobium sp. oral taxon 810 str. F0209]
MERTQFATRVEDDQAEIFRETTRRLGTTPADAIRVFIYSFNECGGFPYDVRLRDPVSVEPFEDETEATDFATRMALEAMR